MARDLKRSLSGSIGARYDTTALCFLCALIASSQGPHGKPGNNHSSRLPHPARHPTRTRFEHAPHSLPAHKTRCHHHCCGQSTNHLPTYLPTPQRPSNRNPREKKIRRSDIESGNRPCPAKERDPRLITRLSLTGSSRERLTERVRSGMTAD